MDSGESCRATFSIGKLSLIACNLGNLCPAMRDGRTVPPRELVADEPAPAMGKDWGTAHQAGAV